MVGKDFVGGKVVGSIRLTEWTHGGSRVDGRKIVEAKWIDLEFSE